MSWAYVFELIRNIMITQTGIPNLAIKELFMIGVAFFFLYLAVAKKYEPLLLVPIGFGIFLVNFPLVPLMGFSEHGNPELIRAFYKYGIEWEIIPCVIFLGLGAMTDFGPLIANPKTLVIGAGAQLGVFITYIGVLFFGFTLKEAASVGIIGGADGPTTIYLTAKLAPHLLGANALAAYSYMAMVPLIQPPIMRLMTTPEQRRIKMRQLRPVSAQEKLLFPLIATDPNYSSDSGGRPLDGDVHVRQFHAGMRRGQAPFRYGPECPDEHRHHFSRPFGGCHHAGG